MGKSEWRTGKEGEATQDCCLKLVIMVVNMGSVIPEPTEENKSIFAELSAQRIKEHLSTSSHPHWSRDFSRIC